MQLALNLFIFSLCLVFMAQAKAQNIIASDEGTQIEQQFERQAAPLSQAPTQQLILETTSAPNGAETISIDINRIVILGSSIYSQVDLDKLSHKLLGKKRLSEIYDLATQLTALYRNEGYLLSRVIVPPQELEPSAATIHLQVIEGWIDEVVWPEGTRAYRDFFSDYAKKITSARPIHSDTLERYLLLANDLPGLTFESTIEPSTANTGASRLILTSSLQRSDYSASANNHGTEGRGPYQFNAGIGLSNHLKNHERISANFATSFDTQELIYGQLGYQQVLTSQGLTFNVLASADAGEPGTATLRALSFKSKSQSVEASLMYPLIRSRTKNFSFKAGIFAKDYNSETFNGRFNQDKIRGVRLDVNFDYFDQWNGISQFSTTLSQGIDGFGSTSNKNSFATRTNGRVDFTKIEFGFSRYQNLANNFSVFGSTNTQYAGTPLLSSEECTYGGNTFGRPFDSSVLSGDHCIKVLGEVRYDIPDLPSSLTQAQLFGFADFGKTWQRSPASSSPNSEEAGSAGFGLRLDWQDRLNAELSAARRIHGSAGDNDWRTRFSLTVKR